MIFLESERKSLPFAGGTVTTFTNQEFQQNIRQIQTTALSGPVMITRRGKPSLIILKPDDYRRLTRKGLTHSERLSLPAEDYADDFELSKLSAFISIEPTTVTSRDTAIPPLSLYF